MLCIVVGLLIGTISYFIKCINDNNIPFCTKGKNPFATFNFGDKTFDQIVKLYDPPYTNSTDVYANIKNNIDSWVEEAITIRGRY